MIEKFRIKETLLEDIAAEYIIKRKLSYSENSLIRESGRIERIAESYFISEKDREYNEFMVDWLMNNRKDIIDSEKFDFDVSISDEMYENNISFYTRKF